jgi:hypothetical protein
VLKSSDEGFNLFGTAQDEANAGAQPSLSSGELTLPAGTDSRGATGGLGIGKAIGRPLVDLTALSYSYHINSRANGNTTQAPTAILTLSGAARTTPSPTGFTNIVCEPIYTQADSGNQVPASGFLDVVQGARCFSTSPVANQPTKGDFLTIAQIKINNPKAVLQQVALYNANQGSVSGGADELLLGLGGTNTRYDFGG